MSARTASAWLAIALALVIACAPNDPEVPVSDTGYEGTWERGNDRVRSFVSILRDGDEYLFRTTLRSRDGEREIRCDWDDGCREIVSGEVASTFSFRTWVDPDSGHLMVECTGRVTYPRERPIHYVDELVLGDHGTSLWAYTVERDGQRFEENRRPRRRLSKVSDGVTDPPLTR